MRVESERVEPGLVRQKTPFARIDLAPGPRLDELVDELRAAGFEIELAPDEQTLLWEKLSFLAPIALTTTALGAPHRRRAGGSGVARAARRLPRGDGRGRGSPRARRSTARRCAA